MESTTIVESMYQAISIGDDGPVRSVIFSRKGDLIAGCNGKVVKILESATGMCLATLHGHEEEVQSLAFSQDVCSLLLGRWTVEVRVWDVQTGALVITLEGHARMYNPQAIAFSPLELWLHLYPLVILFTYGPCLRDPASAF